MKNFFPVTVYITIVFYLKGIIELILLLFLQNHTRQALLLIVYIVNIQKLNKSPPILLPLFTLSFHFSIMLTG